MATRKDVEQKSANEALVVRTWRNPESQRVHFRFFRAAHAAPVAFLSEGWIAEHVGARSSLQWLKRVREERLAREDAQDLAAQFERA